MCHRDGSASSRRTAPAGLTPFTRAPFVRSSKRPIARLAQPDYFSQIALIMLAYCNMRTLYLRNVPDEVVHRLETLARREGLSVSAMAVRELAGSTCRADNPVLLGDLPDLDVSTADILAALHEGRSER